MHFGIDPVVSFVPVIGDLVMATASVRLIVLARRLGARSPVMAHMAVNVLIDLLLGIIPVGGPVMDIFYRANIRNFDLLLREIKQARAASLN